MEITNNKEEHSKHKMNKIPSIDNSRKTTRRETTSLRSSRSRRWVEVQCSSWRRGGQAVQDAHKRLGGHKEKYRRVNNVGLEF